MDERAKAGAPGYGGLFPCIREGYPERVRHLLQ